MASGINRWPQAAIMYSWLSLETKVGSNKKISSSKHKHQKPHAVVGFVQGGKAFWFDFIYLQRESAFRDGCCSGN